MPRHFEREQGLDHGEQTTISIVDKIDLRPGIHCPFDAGAETPVGQNPFRCIRNQDRVADNGITVADFFDGQVVWQVAWTNGVDPCVKNKKTFTIYHEKSY